VKWLTTVNVGRPRMSNNNEILESPDGGRTIYSRKIGDTHRTLIATNVTPRVDPMDGLKYNITLQEWIYINQLAETRPALKEAIQQVWALYHLIKEDGQTTYTK